MSKRDRHPVLVLSVCNCHNCRCFPSHCTCLCSSFLYLKVFLFYLLDIGFLHRVVHNEVLSVPFVSVISVKGYKVWTKEIRGRTRDYCLPGAWPSPPSIFVLDITPRSPVAHIDDTTTNRTLSLCVY